MITKSQSSSQSSSHSSNITISANALSQAQVRAQSPEGLLPWYTRLEAARGEATKIWLALAQKWADGESQQTRHSQIQALARPEYTKAQLLVTRALALLANPEVGCDKEIEQACDLLEQALELAHRGEIEAVKNRWPRSRWAPPIRVSRFKRRQ